MALKQPLLAVFGSHWLVAYPFLYNIVLVGSCMALNILGMRIFSRILNSLTIFKVIPLFVLILLIPFIINPTFSITGQELSLVPFSLSITIFGYLRISNIAVLLATLLKIVRRMLLWLFL